MSPRLGSLFVFVVLSPSLALADSEKGSHTKFAEVVREYFPRWTGGSGGVLSKETVLRLIASPSVKGDEAAAVAAIHMMQRSKASAGVAFTEEFLLAPHKREPGEQRHKHVPNPAGLFTSFRKHIDSTPHKLFATSTAPTIENMSQGDIGDCYFVAPLGAFVRRSPALVRRMIHGRDEGPFEVDFGDGLRVRVPPVTDAQIALGSRAHQEGLWLTVMEIAAGEVRARRKAPSERTAEDILGLGGDGEFTIQLLTGHRVERVHMRSKEKAPRFGEIDAHLRRFSSERRLMSTGTGKWKLPPGIAHGHEYAVLGIEGGKVHVWNPWGKGAHHTPKGEEGLENGYTMKDGNFFVPVRQFAETFGALVCETEKHIRRRR